MPIVPPPATLQSVVPSCDDGVSQGIAIVPEVTSWKMHALAGGVVVLLLLQFSPVSVAAAE
jgi:hypothetical protein